MPLTIQKTAVKQYRLWLNDPAHPSLQFKTFGLVGSQIPIAPLLLWMEIQRFGFGLDLIRNTNY